MQGECCIQCQSPCQSWHQRLDSPSSEVTLDWQCKCQLENPSKPALKDHAVLTQDCLSCRRDQGAAFLSCSKHMRFDDHLTNKSHPWTPCGGFSWTYREDNIKITFVKRQNKGKKLLGVLSSLLLSSSWKIKPLTLLDTLPGRARQNKQAHVTGLSLSPQARGQLISANLI